jgi:excisionase family DNA binding protein
MNADDIARELGVSKSLVYGLMKTKDFPALRIGAKRIVCYRTEFEKWLHQQKSKK